MKLSIFFLIFFCFTSCFDWCPGTPNDFEKGTEQSMPEEYYFPYQDFSSCQIRTIGLFDTINVKLSKVVDAIVADTSFRDVCEGGYYFESESHLLKFSDDLNEVELSIKFNSFDHGHSPELNLKGVLAGKPMWFFGIYSSGSPFSIDSTRYWYYGNLNSGIDKIRSSDKKKTILLEFGK